MDEFYVYELIDPRDGNPFYIGKGKKDRMYHHVKKVKKNDQRELRKNPHKFYKIKQILNDGFIDISYKIILSGVSEDDAFKKEKEMIFSYGKGNLTNITDGGFGGANEIAAKTNSILRKGKTWEQIYGRDMAVALKKKLVERSVGNKNPFFGKTHTEENKRLFSENSKKLHTGKKRSEEAKKNLSNGISNSPKHKEWRLVMKSEKYKKMYSDKSKLLWQDPVFREKNMAGIKNRKPRSKVYTDEFLINTYRGYLEEKEKTKKYLSWAKYYRSLGIKSPVYFHYKAKRLSKGI